MKINERIIDGIKKGVNRHWRYTKNLLHIKPEYLLTVFVADALTDGFDDINGFKLEIKLEEKTNLICRDILLGGIRISDYFQSPKNRLRDNKNATIPYKIPKEKVDRKGKVDIYVTHDIGCGNLNTNECWIIELKGFDPSSAEFKKEITRLLQFINLNQSKNKCRGCFLVFPTSTEKTEWINKQIDSHSIPTLFQVSTFSEKVDTGEDPEYGIPVYYANCIAITKNNP
ncbi:MAG: hypothetical protein NTW85_05725 [Methylococcales bacterium]|nr:hypothetical protein [Methylococcales bacterium]